ncbi:annexin [Pyxidicoccus parkwayensis]|uniref:Annexin n=1 Tax=Pyxidicoccus parkwayensis TaxID=2813578 RepID=A0ABX7P2E5_9BACT|nr:annexin [Pyxidicoccus parkwaysis]QSQ23333.1 annexin [Pyxidicoccus parkwaysis]
MRVNDGASRTTGTGEASGSGQSSAAAEAERAAREAQRAAEEAARAAAEAARAQAAQAAQAQARAEAAAKKAQDALKQAQAALAQAQKQGAPKSELTRAEQAVARANTAAQQAAASAKSAGNRASNASSFVPAAPLAAPPTRQTPAGPPGVTPGYTKEQAAKDATELYRSMKGGLTGWGTDEDKLFATLDKKSPGDLALIRQSFKEHYNLDLDSTIREELSGDDLTRANSILAGNKGSAGAAAIQQQTGWFGDKDAILKTLQQSSPAERQSIARSFQQMYGKDHKDIQASSPEEFMRKALEPDLNDAQKTQLRSLLATTSATAPAQVNQLEASAARSKVNDALQGFFGADSQKVFDTIKDLPPEQKKILLADPSLQAEMQKKLSKEDYTRARGMLEGNNAAASAAQINSATQGWFGADKSAILDVLKNTKPEELPALKAEFQKQTGRSLESEVRGWGGNDAAVGLRYLNPPAANDKLGQAQADAERLHRAMDGMGTDEAALREVLGNKSKAQINDITAAYKQLYGKDLRSDLTSELGGRDKFEIVDQMFDLGAVDMNAPDAAQQQAARLRAQQKFERSDGLGVIDTIQTWTKGESDSARLERNLTAAETAIATGNTDAANRRLGYSTDDVKDVQETKDSTADMAATAAVVVVTTAAVVATGGAATPLAVAGYAALGAGTRVATQAYFKGDSLGTDGLMQQGALGAVEGATAVIPLPKGLGGGSVAAIEGAEQVAKQTVVQRLKGAAIQGAWEGGIGGATSGAVDQAMQSETWQNGLMPGLAQVGDRAVRDGTIGTVFGAGTGVAVDGVMQGASRLTKPKDIPVVHNPDLPGNTTHVRYDNGKVRIEAGPHATPEQIQAHLETARTLQKYEGPLGQIRQLKDRINQAITGRPGFGTQGFESQLEVKKLKGMLTELEGVQQRIDDRIRATAGKPDAATVAERAALEKEIANVQAQLRIHEVQVRSLDVGRGYVAKFDKNTERVFAGHVAELKQIESGLGALRPDESSLTKLIDHAADLKATGKLEGMDDWIRAASSQSGSRDDLIQRMAELNRAVQQAETLPAGQRIRLDGTGAGPFNLKLEAAGAARTPGALEQSTRAAYSTPEQREAFDIWAARTASSGADVEKVLAKMPPHVRDKQVSDIAADVADIRSPSRARHTENLLDPINPQLAHTVQNGNITVHYEARPPDAHELAQAQKLAAARGEEVHIFGDDAAGRSYPGIDGTIGNPKRPMQLKFVPASTDASAARSMAQGALEHAQHTGMKNVEVFIEVEGRSRADIAAAWNGPLKGNSPPPLGATIDGNAVKRIEIQAADGRMEVVFNPATGAYSFNNL